MYALRELQELLSHQIPSGDPAIIIKDSLLRRLKEVKKERFGAGKRRKKAENPSAMAAAEGGAKEAPGEDTKGVSRDGEQSRYIPKEIRKAVWERDQGRCAFVSTKGRWCTERRWLEFHHIIPFAWRGETSVDNLELRCRTHNAYEGELLFGKVLRKNEKSRFTGQPAGFKTSSTSRGSGADVGMGG